MVQNNTDIQSFWSSCCVPGPVLSQGLAQLTLLLVFCVGSVNIPILKWENMKFRDLKRLARGCTASKRERWDLSPWSRTLEPELSTGTGPCSTQSRFIHIITSSTILLWGPLALFFFWWSRMQPNTPPRESQFLPHPWAAPVFFSPFCYEASFLTWWKHL